MIVWYGHGGVGGKGGIELPVVGKPVPHLADCTRSQPSGCVRVSSAHNNGSLPLGSEGCTELRELLHNNGPASIFV